ncbi:MAG TPA: serine hydrolase domain-containing protein [Candidatus Binataceae bacterium]|nr:serine hydrolase domain-containing protein [Candidatus Binataceae bacterium]
MDELRIEGTCDPRFERVKEAFAENFAQRNEYGASFAIVVDGLAVVDLWAGHADKARTIPWRPDTLVNLFSTTKGVTAICAHRLIDQGLLDLDTPVAAYWPEFARAGKDHIRLRQLLNHRAGLPALRKPVPDAAIYDWSAMTTALAAEEPWWTPGTRHGYHAITIGFLVGEVIRRITGKSLGDYFRDEIAGPLELDCHIGLTAEDDARCGQMIQSPAPPKDQINIFKYAQEHPESVTAKAFFNPPGAMKLGAVNSRAWRAAEIPAANGHATAGALARLYGALAAGGAIDGVRVLEPEAIVRCHTEESSGRDEVLMIPTRFSTGFMLSQAHDRMGPNARTFGHPGAGGSLGFADPDARVGFGYTMNKMGPYILMDPRPRALVEALYESL